MAVSYSSSTSAAEFFGSIVPELANQKTATLSDSQKTISHAIALELTGPESGTWSFHMQDGTVSVSEGIDDAANPIFRIESQTWRDAMDGLNEVLGDFLKFDSLVGLIEETDLSGLDPKLLELLEPITGRSLEIHISDADETVLGVRFGANAPEAPQTTLKLDPATIRAIAANKVQPAQAFMAGRIMLDGDMELAMLLAGFIPEVMPYLPKNLAGIAGDL